MNNAEWYVDWFNSPYYHLLYNNRDYTEANFFIDNLCKHLNLNSQATIWDLACGKGRHSIALNKKGYDVTGTDLADNSINEARKVENERLHFYVHDMRTPFKENYFDAVFNLFTSIGYFSHFDDNFKVFKNVAAALTPGGVLVIDFFNFEKVLASLKSDYTEKREEIDFLIKKTVKNNSIIKRIEFTADNKNFYFEESVSLLKQQDFEAFAKAANLELVNAFGNYKLEAFDLKNSDRLILIFRK
ncbi:MAG: class I SAM-dependent methyltransferase [Bacteroidia bacterium]|nr:class I SAM-dependent methyltransferase [Bacteroidia bacterium]